MNNIVNIYRDQPRNYFKIRLYNSILGFRIFDEITFPENFENFEELLTVFGGVNAGIILSRILMRMGR